MKACHFIIVVVNVIVMLWESETDGHPWLDCMSGKKHMFLLTMMIDWQVDISGISYVLI